MSSKQTHKIFDALLVLQYQSGNDKAATLLIKRWNSRLYRHACWYTKNEEISKDIVQESWTKILQKINELKNPNTFGSWALTIVTRKAIDWQRKHKKTSDFKKEFQHQQNNEKINVEITNREETVVLIRKAIKELPEKQQIVLRLFYVEEYSVKEISDIIQVSVGTVKSRLFTAREQLKLILKNKNYEK